MKHETYLSLGSNLGNKKLQIDNAIQLIADRVGEVIKQSSWYETSPWGFSSDDNFLNIALKVNTNLWAEEVFQNIAGIEQQLGRKRKGVGYASRVIDIDILFYDDCVINQESLTIPHPRLHLRRFVLIPMNEIEPDLIHPILNKSIKLLLSECPDNGIVTKFTQ